MSSLGYGRLVASQTQQNQWCWWLVPQQLMVNSDHGIFHGTPNLFVFIEFNCFFSMEWE